MSRRHRRAVESDVRRRAKHDPAFRAGLLAALAPTDARDAQAIEVREPDGRRAEAIRIAQKVARRLTRPVAAK